MKKDLHPNYEQTEVRCACGAKIATGSTKKDMRVDICGIDRFPSKTNKPSPFGIIGIRAKEVQPSSAPSVFAQKRDAETHPGA